MPFVRTKLVKGISYHYLVESVRVDGKPRQRVIAYLGEHSTVKAACRYWQTQVSAGPDATARKHAREVLKKLKAYL